MIIQTNYRPTPTEAWLIVNEALLKFKSMCPDSLVNSKHFSQASMDDEIYFDLGYGQQLPLSRENFLTFERLRYTALAELLPVLRTKIRDAELCQIPMEVSNSIGEEALALSDRLIAIEGECRVLRKYLQEIGHRIQRTADTAPIEIDGQVERGIHA